MAQSEIQVTTTPPLPGTQLVAEINDALETIATDFSGAIDPAANAFAYSLWADTGTGNLKRRNAANNAWVVVGRIFPDAAPAFSAYVSVNQSLSANTSTKVQFNTKEFDTNTNFDAATNYRFTPTVAGYYQFNSVVYVNNAPADVFQVLFYKNGAAYKQAFYLANSSSAATMIGGSILTYMNGSTDYIEVYANSQSANVIAGTAGSIYTQFSGFLARSAA